MEKTVTKWLVVAVVLLSIAAAGLWSSGLQSGQREAPGRFTQFQAATPTVTGAVRPPRPTEA
jgi:hypothetical protein